MKATRDGFGEQIVKLAANNKDIMVLTADLGKPTKCDTFQKYYPEQYMDIGIAEANMIGIAAGLTLHNKKVFLTSFASFLTGRYDIIRCSIAYPNTPVIMVGTHAGLAIGKDGVTQMGLEDINVMRGLPNIHIYQPATANEAKAITAYLGKINQFAYLRLCRQPSQEIYDDDLNYEFDRIQIVEQGKDLLIIASGPILIDALKAREKLVEQGIFAEVINLSQIKPLPTNLIHRLQYHSKVVTIEDHSIVGGIGSSIAELLAESRYNSQLLRIGLHDIFPESGPPDELYTKFGLTSLELDNTIMQKFYDK